MLQSDALGLGKGIFIAFFLGLLMVMPAVVLAIDTSHVSRWVHTGFFMHKKAYENDRAVLKLLEDSTFDLKYISYFEDNDDTTWEKNMEASGKYQISGKNIIFTIQVLIGTEEKNQPHYSCPFKLDEKALILNSCELFDINNTYEFKRTDPDAFYFE